MKGRNRFLILAGLGIYVGLALIISGPLLEKALFPIIRLPFETWITVGSVIFASSLLAGIAGYLGVFERTDRDEDYYGRQSLEDVRDELSHSMKQLGELIRNNASPKVSVAIGAEIKGEIVDGLIATARDSLSSFIRQETFKAAAERNIKDTQFTEISKEFQSVILGYKQEMAGWRRNANINLIIGLACAIGGILVMWQTLIYIQLAIQSDGNSPINWNDFYRFVARFGLVILIESVAFFFLKLYREDRAMIRYFRNEITNLESRALALKTSITFAQPDNLGKLLIALMATERNFVLKKGERVLSDLVYENNEIILEKLLNGVIQKGEDVLSPDELQKGHSPKRRANKPRPAASQ